MINTVKHYDTQRLGDPLPQSASRRSESFKPKLFTVYRQGSSQLTVFPSCWRNQCGSTDAERGNRLAGVSVYIPRVLVHFFTFTEAS